MKYIYMKQHRSIQYILEHRVRSGFPDSTVRQCKNDKITLHQNTRGRPQSKPSKSAVLFWLDFPRCSTNSLVKEIFFKQNYFETEAKYSYMIDAVTKSKLIFIFGKINLKLKNISYFPILQYFNVSFILLDLSQNANDVSSSLCLENAGL